MNHFESNISKDLKYREGNTGTALCMEKGRLCLGGLKFLSNNKKKYNYFAYFSFFFLYFIKNKN